MAGINSISDLTSKYVNEALESVRNDINDEKSDAFSDLLTSAMSLIKETNQLSNAANAEQMDFALGYSDNTHDLAIAQQKAALSLQYTVAVKNKVLEAYKEIMNMQI